MCAAEYGCLLGYSGGFVQYMYCMCVKLKFSNILNELYLRMKIVTKHPVPLPTLPSHILNTKTRNFFFFQREMSVRKMYGWLNLNHPSPRCANASYSKRVVNTKHIYPEAIM